MQCHGSQFDENQAINIGGLVVAIVAVGATVVSTMWTESRAATRHVEQTELSRTEIRLHAEENERDTKQYHSSIRPSMRFERFAAAAFNSARHQVGCKYCGEAPLIKNNGSGSGSDIAMTFLVTGIGGQFQGPTVMETVKARPVTVYPISTPWSR